MNSIRQQKRECTDKVKINQFLDNARTGFLGLSQHEEPYVIPLNFIWRNGHIYFHGASEGRKEAMMSNNSNVCFTVSEEYGTITDPVPANIDTAYMCVLISGKAEKVLDLAEKVNVMQAMIDKYVPGYFKHPLSKTHVDKYRSSLGSETTVYKVVPSSLSAKENPWQLDKMFFKGKEIKDDL
ncbi:MAG: pyridoxamine 5'-phosphate oxidase family protein [Bacillota bacterium]|nr:pyridoxamine 5'-phosphate oxidase family protein [Bacillota bacterium]